MGYECDTDSFEYPCETNNTLYQWTTGGGFSQYIARPSYQTAVVASYLNTKALMPPKNKFPYQNRGCSVPLNVM